MSKNAGKRLLVLYIDRDDDLGRTLNAKTPIVGREENLKVATRFILASPEDPDANALFSAIQVYDKLREEDARCEIATLTGVYGGGIKADMKLTEELDEILKKYPAEGVVLVSDGEEDELVIPVIQSRLPIISIRRVVIRQSRGLEETYFLMIRYLKRVLEDPKYSIYMIGIPGIFFMIVAIMVALGMVHYVGISLLFFIGLTLMVKGFSIDRKLEEAWSSSPTIFSSSIIAIITFSLSSYLGASAVQLALSQGGETLAIPQLIGIFLSLPHMPIFLAKVYNSDILMVGIVILLIGRALDKYVKNKPKIWHDVSTIILCILLTILFREVANLLINPLYTPLTFMIWLLITASVYGGLVVAFILYERMKGK